jgi:hypothetical protein
LEAVKAVHEMINDNCNELLNPKLKEVKLQAKFLSPRKAGQFVAGRLFYPSPTFASFIMSLPTLKLNIQ